MNKNRSGQARKQSGLSLAQSARLLRMEIDELKRVEESDASYASTDRVRMASVYGVDIEWMDGAREVRDYASIDRMRGAGRLSAHDRDALAEFAASLPRRQVSAPARYEMSQRPTRDHKCHWPSCDRQVPPAMWGCETHWFMLPKSLRDRVWSTYRPGQERDMSPSEEYLAVANEVQRWIREHAPRGGKIG